MFIATISLDLMVIAGVRSISIRKLIFGELVTALELTGMRLLIITGGIMKFKPRL